VRFVYARLSQSDIAPAFDTPTQGARHCFVRTMLVTKQEVPLWCRHLAHLHKTKTAAFRGRQRFSNLWRWGVSNPRATRILWMFYRHRPFLDFGRVGRNGQNLLFLAYVSLVCVMMLTSTHHSRIVLRRGRCIGVKRTRRHSANYALGKCEVQIFHLER
jgi:hypothetical protein